jgi:hypothetical protein
MRTVLRLFVVALACLAAPIAAIPVQAQTTSETSSGSASATADNAILLTVFFRHDQSPPLGELNAQLAKQGFYKQCPPPGVEVVSWYVMMGIGQVITLRLPASRLREVNRVLEKRPGEATAPSSIPPTTTKLSASPNTKRLLHNRVRNRAALILASCSLRSTLLLTIEQNGGRPSVAPCQILLDRGTITHNRAWLNQNDMAQVDGS